MLDRFTGGGGAKRGLMASVPLKRLGKTDELARAIRFSASEDASFVTGHVLTVDGGKTAG